MFMYSFSLFLTQQRRGLETTYWLVGKEGFEGQLPDPPPDNAEVLFETVDVYYAS